MKCSIEVSTSACLRDFKNDDKPGVAAIAVDIFEMFTRSLSRGNLLGVMSQRRKLMGGVSFGLEYPNETVM
jgi:hypothetical protein